MNARVVLFLGRIDDADPTRYALAERLDQAPSRRFHLPWQILVNDAMTARPEARIQVVVVGSGTAFDDWEYELDQDARDAGFADRGKLPIGFVRYDEAALSPINKAVFWGFFETLRSVLGGEPVSCLGDFEVIGESPRPAFAEPADYVVLDITRGFRAVPFIGASALAFVQATERRKMQETPGYRGVGHRIYYAAKKVETDGITPLWDMTPFVEGVELSDALDAFARHGRADDLARFFNDSEVPAARDLAEPMKRFADDLLLMRIPSLLKKSAPDVQKALSASLKDLKHAYPSVSDDLQRFKDQIDQLAPNGEGPDPVSLEGLRAAVVLADRLWQTRRYAELYGLLRESLLTAFTVVYIQEPHYQPDRQGQPDFDVQRERVELVWYPLIAPPNHSEKPRSKKARLALSFNSSHIEKARAIARQIKCVSDLRNDVAHCSMRYQPKKEEPLRKALRDSLDDFRGLVASLRPS